VRDVVVTPVLVDTNGRVIQTGRSLRIGGTVGPGQRASTNAGLNNLGAEQLRQVRVRVDSVRPE
jgi:hypothetical protein